MVKIIFLSRQRCRDFTSDESLQRDKLGLDIFRLKDERLEDSDNLPAPHLIAAEIAADLRSALEQFEEIMNDLDETQESATASD